MSNNRTTIHESHIQDIENEINTILYHLEDEWIALTGNDKTEFISSTFEELLSQDQTSGDDFAKTSITGTSTVEELHAYLYLNPLLIVMAYLAEAVRWARLAKVDNSVELIVKSWQLISKARWWCGMIFGRRAKIEADVDIKRKKAQKAANARHEENHQLREQARRFYEINIFGTKDEAAQAITKQVPVAFSTARKWVTDFSKK